MNLQNEIILQANSAKIFTEMDADGLLINFRKYLEVLKHQPEAENYQRGYNACKAELERRNIFITQ